MTQLLSGDLTRPVPPGSSFVYLRSSGSDWTGVPCHELMASGEDCGLKPQVSLIGRHEPYGAVAVHLVVPVDEVSDPLLTPRLCQDLNGRAYNRTAFMAGRREMMQGWADYLDRLTLESVVVPTHSRAA